MDKNAVAKEVYFIKFLRDAISGDLAKVEKVRSDVEMKVSSTKHKGH
jgi:hypothetical protein